MGFDKDKMVFGPKNFKYLDELIHSGAKEIVLESDIVLGTGEKCKYWDGIQLDIDDLAIDGNGHTIDAKGKTRIFHLTKGNITLRNITLKNGYQYSGGAIYNDEGCLNIVKSKFSINRAEKNGCAIYNYDGKVTLKDSEFAGNVKSSNLFESVLEEDIYNSGNLIVLGKYSSDNIKSIYNDDCVCVSLDYVDKIHNLDSMSELKLQLENCRGSDYLNDLIHEGGDEIVLDSNIVMDDSKAIELAMDNLVIDGGGHCIDAKGGHIFRNDRKGIVLKNITLINAEDGAIVNSGEMELYDCRLINNKNFDGNFRDCHLSQTYEYVYGGGAVFNTGRMNFIRCSLLDNMVYNETSYTIGAGAAIFNLNGEIKLANCRISGNISTINYEEDGIDECTSYGGAILSLNGKIDIADCEFTRNCSFDGGGIYGFSTEISIANTRFAGNGFRHTFGGAMCVRRSKTRITDSEFDSNSADCGGAIYVSEGEMEILDGIFKSNHANGHGGEGGAVDASRCRLTIDGGEFIDNAADYGGAISLFDCDEDIHAKFYGNEAHRGNTIEYFHGLGRNMNNFDEEL